MFEQDNKTRRVDGRWLDGLEETGIRPRLFRSKTLPVQDLPVQENGGTDRLDHLWEYP